MNARSGWYRALRAAGRWAPLAVLVLAAACAGERAAPAPGPAAASPSVTPATAGGAATMTITIGYPVLSATYLQHFIGQEQGFWQAEGLAIEPALTNGVPAIVQAVVGGSYQLGSVSADVGISAVEQGADVVYVAGELRQAVFSVMAQPEIHAFTDVRGGKVIGAASVRGGTSTLLRALFTQHGLKEGDDYSLVAAGSTTERVAALRSRAIDAGLFAQPHDFMMRDEGFTLLATTQDAFPHYAMSALLARRDWARGNDDVLVRALRAHIRSLRWLYDPANKEAFIDALVRHTRTDERYARRTYELLIEQYQTFAKDGALTPEPFEGAMKLMLDAGDLRAPLPPERYLDRTWWERAISSLP
ncbi:MAG: ABC transporter substrate-binding protein [Chloroflexi bacterium]|nr:ABC transporter substrate-binding protein [Chloroflexota bacterium]